MSSITPKLERRIFAAQLRADDGNNGRKMIGYAAVYNSDSEDLGGFTERIAPGAFNRALAEKQDVRCLINHDANMILARSKSGTLELNTDENGLAIRCDLPDTSYGRDLLVSLVRGDIDQMSFGFVVRNEKWADDEGVECPPWSMSASKRTILDVDLFDVSAVTYPAYPETSCEARTKFLFPDGKPEAPSTVLVEDTKAAEELAKARAMTRLREISLTL
jgi:HK97 family phage prohead protease